MSLDLNDADQPYFFPLGGGVADDFSAIFPNARPRYDRGNP